MKITVLTENSKGCVKGVKEEFGLSLLIESGDRTILLDSGSSDVFAANASVLNKDLSKVDWFVISHGHYDHGGGIGGFFKNNETAKAVIRKGAGRPAYGSLAPGLPSILHKAGIITRYIGLDSNLLEEYKDRFMWIDSDQEIMDGVHVLTNIVNTHSQPEGNKYLLTKIGEHFIQDDFTHELVLLIEEDNKGVVFSGCAHNGILNMLETVKNFKPELEIKAVIGGFHLNMPRSEKMSAPENEIVNLAKKLGYIVSGSIYTGHCTGLEAFRVMKPELGDKLQPLHTGDSFEV